MRACARHDAGRCRRRRCCVGGQGGPRQLRSQSRSVLTWPGLPMSSAELLGRCLLTHSCPPPLSPAPQCAPHAWPHRGSWPPSVNCKDDSTNHERLQGCCGAHCATRAAQRVAPAPGWRAHRPSAPQQAAAALGRCWRPRPRRRPREAPPLLPQRPCRCRWAPRRRRRPRRAPHWPLLRPGRRPRRRPPPWRPRRRPPAASWRARLLTAQTAAARRLRARRVRPHLRGHTLILSCCRQARPLLMYLRWRKLCRGGRLRSASPDSTETAAG